jgi:hypothetical protein
MTDDERFDNMIATVAATSAQLAARMTTFKSRAPATQHRVFFRPSPYKASTGCCSHESSMSSGMLQMAGSP